MRSYSVRVQIDAKPDEVFHVLTDFDCYQKWNPWHNIKGKPVQGECIRVKPNSLMLPGSLHCRIYKNQNPDILVWGNDGWFRLLVKIRREQELYLRMDGTSLYVMRMQLSGLLGRLVLFFYGKLIRNGLRSESLALKSFCEKGLTC